MGVLASLAQLTAYSFSDDRRVDTRAQLQQAQATLDALNAEAALRTSPDAARLVRSTATVTSSAQTGVTVNDGVQLALGLLVLLPGGVPVPVSTVSLVPMARIPQAQPGCSVPVRLDPRSPAVLTIDWHELG